jgi:hypothetical protein
MQGDPDATRPIPTGGGEPTIPAQGGLGDPTIPVTRPEYGGPGRPGGGGPGGGGGWDDDEEGDRRKFWMIAGGVLVLGLLVGALVAILLSSGGDDETAATTSSSSSTSTSLAPTTAPTTPTTTAAGPQILGFDPNPSPYPCPGSGNIQLTWSTQNTSGVTISIDSPNPYGNYQSTGNQSVPFSCPANQHTYVLTANGTNGQSTQKTLIVQGLAPPTTAAPPTT